MLQIKGHCSYFGKTGFNIYSRGFFSALKKLYPKLSIRNFTSLEGEEITDIDKELVDELSFYILDENKFESFNPNWLSSFGKPSKGDINIILNETNHYYFYDDYDGVKIAYNMWETTQQPANFFNKLLEFDQIWVPSGWQKEMLVNQGIPQEKVFIVSGGVDTDFFPINKENDGIIRFLIVGAWSFRKSTKEMIESFLYVFKDTPNVELLLLVDNSFNKDGLNSTEERLMYYGLEHPKIKILHKLDRESYIKTLKNCDVFLACSKGEGWNLPLIEALACGIPSIFSDCGSHKEFASSYPLKVEVDREIPAVCKIENVDFTGNYYEPNFNQFCDRLLETYKNLEHYRQVYLNLSTEIISQYSWDNSAKKAMELLVPYLFKSTKQTNKFFVEPTITEILEPNDKTLNSFIYKEIFDYQIYNHIPEMKIEKGNVVLDVGAHIGIFSRYAEQQGAIRVIAMEMNPKYFSCLRLNVRPQDDVFNCVLLDKTFTRFKLENDILVIGFDLNYFFKGGLFDKIDFMKVDVSGKELTLLYSIEQKVYDVIKKISIKMYNLSDEEKNKIVEFMNNIGFSHFYNILLQNQFIQLLYFWK